MTVLTSKTSNCSCPFTVGALLTLLKTLTKSTRWSAFHNSRKSLVECLRCIAEVVIWGDQNNKEITNIFRQNDGLAKIVRLTKKKSNRRGEVAVQLLQTLAMLVQNVKSSDTLFYILSHEAVGQIISMDFDFTDEEVLGYYVSLVKSISFKLNESIVVSYIKKSAPKSNQFSMPLFSEAAKFVDSPEQMVRAAARTLTLTIISLKSDRVDGFLTSAENRVFFRNCVRGLRQRIANLEKLDSGRSEYKGAADHLEGEIEDIVCYLNDIYKSSSSGVQMELAYAAWDELLGGYLSTPLYNAMSNQLKGGQSKSLSEEGLPLLKMPKIETLIDIASRWIPLKHSDFQKSIFTTFVTNTMNALLKRSEFVFSRVVMHAINQAFHALELSASRRLEPLLNIDLETFDLSEEPEWRIEASKINTKIKPSIGPTVGPLEFAEYIGLDVCADVLQMLFRQTSCEKYKPSPLLEKLARNPDMTLRGRRYLSFTSRSLNPMTLSTSKNNIRRTMSMTWGSIPHQPVMRRSF